MFTLQLYSNLIHKNSAQVVQLAIVFWAVVMEY